MLTRRITKVAGTALGATSLLLLSAAPASAHYREYQLGNVVGAVGATHRTWHLCELGPGTGAILIELTNGLRFTWATDDRCINSEMNRNINAFKVGWDQGGGYLWSNWVAP